MTNPKNVTEVERLRVALDTLRRRAASRAIAERALGDSGREREALDDQIVIEQAARCDDGA